MKKWHVALGILLLFGAGVLAGAGGSLLIIRHKLHQAIAGGPDQVRAMLMTRLTRELRLEPGQRADVERAVRDAQAKMLVLRTEYQPRVEKIIDDGIAQMEPGLSPEQRTKLQQLCEKIRARWRPPMP